VSERFRKQFIYVFTGHRLNLCTRRGIDLNQVTPNE